MTASAGPARAATGSGPARRAALRDALHLVTLASVALAQPAYSVLANSPEFFVAYRATRRDILALVAILSVGVPVALWCLEGLAALFGRTSRRVAHTVLVGALAAVVVLEALRAAGDVPPALSFVLAAAGGSLFAWAYTRFSPVGSFLSALSPAALVFPLVFLTRPSLSPFMTSALFAPGSSVTVARPAPITMVVFDQFPLVSLLGPDGGLDKAGYPGFSELAATSTWYSNATANGNLTDRALSAILSGTYYRPRSLPIYRHYPHNLFSLLSRSCHFEVTEPITKLCPNDLCPDPDESARGKALVLAGDVAVVLGHVAVPRRMERRLPSVTQRWQGFVNDQHWHQRWVRARGDDRRADVRDFIQSIGADDPKNTLHFLHVLLPHDPFVYGPAGQRLTDRSDLPGLGPNEVWVNDDWIVADAYRRHLMQVAFMDSVVHALIARLRAAGRFDDSLVIVTADHGVSFWPGRPFRRVSPSTLPDMAAVPLFIKRPHQTAGAVDPRNVEGVDILPSIASALGVELPWKTDGSSVFGPPTDTRPGKRLYGDTWMTLPADIRPSLRPSIERKFSLFQPGPIGEAPPSTSPHVELLGKHLDELRIEDGPQMVLDFPEAAAFGNVDPDGDAVPADIRGAVAGSEERRVVAVALNGRIVSTTWTDSYWWRVLLGPNAFKRGANELEVFSVATDAHGLVLRRGLSLSGR